MHIQSFNDCIISLTLSHHTLSVYLSFNASENGIFFFLKSRLDNVAVRIEDLKWFNEKINHSEGFEKKFFINIFINSFKFLVRILDEVSSDLFSV